MNDNSRSVMLNFPMPETCEKCPLSTDHIVTIWCNVYTKRIEYRRDYETKRKEDCPLVELELIQENSDGSEKLFRPVR